MSKNGLKTILVFSLFLVLFSFRGYADPIGSNPINVTPSNYEPSTYSIFNVTWSKGTVDTIVDTSQVKIEIDYTGTPEEYSMILISGNESTGTYGFQEILGAGTYEWKSCAKDNETKEDCTDEYYFTIGQANNLVTLYFRNSTDEYINQNMTITYGTLVNVTGISAGGTVNIYRNEVNVISENSQNILLGTNIDGYDYKVNATGNQNYSDNSTGLTYYIFVNEANPSITLLLDRNDGSVTIDRNWTINFTAYSNIPYVNVTLYTNLTGWVNQTDTTTVYNLTKLIDSGVYEVTAYIFDNQNYSSDNVTYYLTIDEIAPQYSNVSVDPPINFQYDPDKIYQFNITWQDGSLDNVTFNIYNTSVLYTNPINITFNSILNSTDLVNYTLDENIKIFSVNIPGLPKGNYNYVWIAFDTFNFNNRSIPSSYVVKPKDISTNITLLINPTSLPSGGGSVTASCSAENYPVNLTLSFIGFAGGSKTGNRGESVSLSATLTQTTEITCYITGNNNYTGSKYGTVTVASTLSSPDGGIDVPGKFTIENLASSVSINAGETKPTTFKLKNTLNNDLLNVTISLTGIDSSWYSISKIDKVRHGTSESVTITFNIPEDAETKDYSITIKAEGKPHFGSKKTASKKLTLTVNPAEAAPETVGSPAEENVTDNETATTGIATGLISIRPEDMANILLFFGFIACALIFIYRGKITNILTGKYKRKPVNLKSLKLKRPSFIKSLKKKLRKIKRKKFK